MSHCMQIFFTSFPVSKYLICFLVKDEGKVPSQLVGTSWWMRSKHTGQFTQHWMLWRCYCLQGLLGTMSHACMCPSLWDLMDCSPWGSSVHGIFQARILEWVVISYFRGSSRPKDQILVSCISCFGRQILYHWATREALSHDCAKHKKVEVFLEWMEP